MEKTADEMFEELRYEKIEDKYNIDFNKRYSFTNGDKIQEQIRFCKLDKYICIKNFNFNSGISFGKFLDMQELKAIYKKCEELRMDIEQAIETMQHWIDYEKKNKDKINKADELIEVQETILKEKEELKKINIR